MNRGFPTTIDKIFLHFVICTQSGYYFGAVISAMHTAANIHSIYHESRDKSHSINERLVGLLRS
jgi:hypothetical protein